MGIKLTTEILSHDQINPTQWDAFIENSPQGALYALHGYATTIAGHWQAAFVKKGDNWLAVMPFVSSQKWGLKYSLQPLFSQYWGVFFASFEGSAYKQLSLQRKCLEALLPVWEPFRLVKYRLAPETHYLLPYHWKGFQLQPRFTYLLALEEEEKSLWQQLASPLQRQIRKIEKRKLEVRRSTDPNDLLALIQKQKARGHDVLGGAKGGMALLRKLIVFLQTSGYGEIYLLPDEASEPLAAALIAHFRSKSMYLIGAFDPETRDSGAMSFLMWQAILQARQKKAQYFDFEGSMIEGIEGFFRKFGASPTTYFEISKNTLPLPLKWMDK